MIRKVSLKVARFAILSVGFALVLFACPKPVDLESYLEDPTVVVIIEKGKGSVNITSDSDDFPSLIAGNSRISGLDPNKYYMVEEWDEEGIFKSVQFVSAGGARAPTLTGIGMVSGGAITGLTNFYNYRVTDADPVSGDITWYDFTAPTGPPPTPASADKTTTENDVAGAITLEAPEPGHSYYLDPHPALTDFDIGSFNIVKIPISPSGGNLPVAPVSGNSKIIELEGEGTTTDYVFVEKDSQNAIIHGHFYVLRVEISPAPADLTITVTLSLTGDNSPVIDPAAPPISYSQNETGTIDFTVNNPTQYSDFTWYVDGQQVSTVASFSLNKGDIAYKIIGVYTIIVEATLGGIPYSAAIEVTVTP